ncbi:MULTISPECIES: methyl-accepting chemotaxis protein [Methylobacterium]|jgi:methyl-accepting chemotaxis protein|uniref:Chemotaxis protein n=2 Tax=Methylobacterium TaxID=407 RepID=A0A0C6FLU6_9HYPH|nr:MULTISPECIES: methyl-accepting chemotaxis protein [Methylobacterium]MBZ6414201.1 methyl-accepting chemotaxis protein [Methylobacterium sp.]MBK3397220.1 methyl-accepting chemotaxis protein [Methylobacterium ajmalii]MBK3410006.1 methyl-accepting chemotaxis protein [Methylobacterium ajmalii]MBK3422582.1 methyl-accepting chemotaxis protein [Methylobacterium ajmalii]SFF53903.1 Methyl-accepting chemotaxis protein [Methylobacterium sp. yr596]
MFRSRHAPAPVPVETPEMVEERLAGLVERAGASGSDLGSGRLARSLGQLVGRLQVAAAADLGSTARVAAEASEAATVLGWMTHDASEIAGQTRAMAAAVEEVAASTRELAGRSQASAEVAERASGGIASCAADMREASSTMAAIETHAGQIEQRLTGFESAALQIQEMAGTIEAISSQTNLLALNATIEAARAGEAGRGFAVVAAEVKQLSGQTARATEQIRGRLAVLLQELAAIQAAVAESRHAVASGTAAVARVEARVVQEGDAVARSAEGIRALAEVLGQQEAATAEISSGVQQVAGKAQKTSDEIKGLMAILVRAETKAQEVLDAGATRDLPGYRLLRLPADMGMWKRRLAAALVGLGQASAAVPAFATGDAAELGLDASHPAAPQIVAACTEARRHAAAMVEALGAGAWDKAIPAFQAFEAAAKTLVTAAEGATRH